MRLGADPSKRPIYQNVRGVPPTRADLWLATIVARNQRTCDNRGVTSFPFTAELIVERYLSGVRVDSFLARHFRNYTPYRLQRLVAAGQVKIDGTTVDIKERVYHGDTVSVRLIEPPDRVHPPEPLPLDIVYEDAWMIVVDKPPGQITHPAGDLQRGTLCNALQHHFDRQTALPGLLKPGIVHRLDRMTSGLIVVAKEHLAHRQLSIQFQRERISKSYLALVEGALPSDRGTIDVPIGTSPEAGSVLMSCSPDAGDRRESRTDYEVLGRNTEHTLVRARPRTGRNHQIRLHFASIGHPVVGDEFYGPFGSIKLSKAEYKALCARRANGQSHGLNRESADESEAGDPTGRHALHAHRLEFEHPILGGRVAFESPWPSDLRALVDGLAIEHYVAEASSSVSADSLGTDVPSALHQRS
jgi:23S rRNA pseudouridine1911/1915/1917 synthase